MHEGVTAVYRSNVDLFFYVLGSQGENEVSVFMLHTESPFTKDLRCRYIVYLYSAVEPYFQDTLK